MGRCISILEARQSFADEIEDLVGEAYFDDAKARIFLGCDKLRLPQSDRRRSLAANYVIQKDYRCPISEDEVDWEALACLLGRAFGVEPEQALERFLKVVGEIV